MPFRQWILIHLRSTCSNIETSIENATIQVWLKCSITLYINGIQNITKWSYAIVVKSSNIFNPWYNYYYDLRTMHILYIR